MHAVQVILTETFSAAGLSNPEALFRNAIFNGDFLDTRYARPFTRLCEWFPGIMIPSQFFSGVRSVSRIWLFLVRFDQSVCSQADAHERVRHNRDRHILRRYFVPLSIDGCLTSKTELRPSLSIRAIYAPQLVVNIGRLLHRDRLGLHHVGVSRDNEPLVPGRIGRST